LKQFILLRFRYGFLTIFYTLDSGRVCVDSFKTKVVYFAAA